MLRLLSIILAFSRRINNTVTCEIQSDSNKHTNLVEYSEDIEL